FAKPLARIAHRAALGAEIDAALAGGDAGDWAERLSRAGVPAGPIFDLAQVFGDPQVLAREMLVEMPHPEVGTFKTTGLPFTLSRSPGAIRRRPPLHGEHTDEVLAESGVSAEEIAKLRAEQVI